MLTTFSEIIDEYGGAAPFAREFGLDLSAVCRAKRKGQIPYKWRMPLFQDAQRRKIKIAPELLGMEAHS